MAQNLKNVLAVVFTLGLALGLALTLSACQPKPKIVDSTTPAEESQGIETKTNPEEILNTETGETMANQAINPAEGYQRTEEITNFVNIHMANGDNIVVELDPSTAPATVANFQKLVSEGFYDGIIFHRIIPGFMVQGGDPTGTGMGGSKETIKGEFAQNGVENNLLHKRGVISMARSMDMDSASSQFFLMHADAPHLDGAYAAFGQVVYGLDAVDRIAESKTGANDRPMDPPTMEAVFFVEKAD